MAMITEPYTATRAQYRYLRNLASGLADLGVPTGLDRGHRGWRLAVPAPGLGAQTPARNVTVASRSDGCYWFVWEIDGRPITAVTDLLDAVDRLARPPGPDLATKPAGEHRGDRHDAAAAG